MTFVVSVKMKSEEKTIRFKNVSFSFLHCFIFFLAVATLIALTTTQHREEKKIGLHSAYVDE